MKPENRMILLLLLVVLMLSGCAKPDQQKVQPTKSKPAGKTSNVPKTPGAQIPNLKTNSPVTAEAAESAGPAQVERLHREARAKGEEGDYAAALELLKQASELAPEWAYPHYDMAFTYLLQGNWTNAYAKYKEVDRLEPKGFYTTKTALWTLEREWSGVFPRGTYLTFVSLEWAGSEKQHNTIEAMNTNLPAFAPAWKERAMLTEPRDERLAFFEKALSLQPDPETYGICMLNKATLLNQLGQSTQARRILDELLSSEASTTSTKALAEQIQRGLR